MSREKRPLKPDANTEAGYSEEKRRRVPALASVIVEAVKMDSLQKLCSSLEPLLRRVVGEEVERALAKHAPPSKIGWSSPKRLQGSDSRILRLQFRSKLALPLFTGGRVEGEQGTAIHVVLQDVTTGQVVTSGPEASAKLEVMVLEGDFSVDDEEDWTQEDFENFVVKEREGKRPLLTGDLSVALKEGVGTLGEITFTDNSSWIRSRKFRLGVKVASGSTEGLRIREAKTEAFTVKDHRGELYKKHYPPALHDEIWRLDKIGKDGAFHKRLNQAGIHTVEDFLRLVIMDPQKLRNILGSGMSNKMWEGTVEHAKTCVLSGKLYVYYADNRQNVGVIFNNIFQLMGLIGGGQYVSVDSLSDAEKVYVDKLVKVAYENWETVVEYDGGALIGTPQYNLRGINAEADEPSTSQVSDTLTIQPGVPLHHKVLSATQDFPAVQSSISAVSASSSSGIISSQKQMDSLNVSSNMMPNDSMQISRQGTAQPNMTFGTPTMTDLSLIPTQNLSSSTSYQYQPTNSVPRLETLNSSDWFPYRELRSQTSQLEGLYSEEEIRQKSLELLDNEDIHVQMQQLLRMFDSNVGEPGSVCSQSITMPAYAVTPYESCPSPRQKTESGGKAYVGWLKLKAVMRWGIFIRKRAAERRAKLDELGDDS
ncbi:hypothetical protein O6H91_09G031200 [Diphasiastrum complanatum]|uniref:Uncharacterized protein n=2 Tax=Diphasiastrum complanatum TaxID=34168 RepID=A0ACC2CMN0_DIPCM|nr:hypothetical protein O6H91_09G031200 [Diphasiastrum complanatum]